MKTATTIEKQIEILRSHGIIIKDEEKAKEILHDKSVPSDEEEAISSLEEPGCSSLLADEESSPQATSEIDAANANENAQKKVVILFIVILLYPTNV
mgnify:CR=1 FL=1